MRSTHYSALLFAVLAAACAKAGDKVADSSAGMMASSPAMTTTTAMPAPMFSLKNAAGTWHLVARPADGKDTSATMSTLTTTADTTGWTMTFGKAKPVPLHVRVNGDSVTAVSDQYPSVRRKGVMVTTISSFQMQGDKLVGTTVAHYKVKTADSVLVLHTEATKAP